MLKDLFKEIGKSIAQERNFLRLVFPNALVWVDREKLCPETNDLVEIGRIVFEPYQMKITKSGQEYSEAVQDIIRKYNKNEIT